MKKNIKDFFMRGLAAAWGGPVIMAIVWAVLKSAEAPPLEKFILPGGTQQLQHCILPVRSRAVLNVKQCH